MDCLIVHSGLAALSATGSLNQKMESSSSTTISSQHCQPFPLITHKHWKSFYGLFAPPFAVETCSAKALRNTALNGLSICNLSERGHLLNSSLPLPLWPHITTSCSTAAGRCLTVRLRSSSCPAMPL